MPGQAVTLSAVIRNMSETAIPAAQLRFFQDGAALGSPVKLTDLEPGEERNVRLTVRTTSVGRYSFSASLSDDSIGAGSPAIQVRKVGFSIAGLPSWWKRLDTELGNFAPTGAPTSTSAMPALAGHTRCQNDIRADFILQRHGEALLAGIRAQKQRKIDVAERHYSDAVAALSDFASALYCVDIDQLAYWDRAIAGFWRSMEKSPEPDMDFRAAVVATWNPALMVLDAIQFTGHSRIIEAYRDLHGKIDSALTEYPVDTYGSTWLDAFGTGKLYRHAGASSASNLVAVMRKPRLLGFGTCALSAHAEKADAGLRCFEHLALITNSCNAKSADEILAGLHETGLILPLISGEFAARSGPTGPVPGQSMAIAGSKLTYQGTLLEDLAADLCAAQKALGQAGGLQGMAESLGGVDFASLGGCGFALVQAALAGQSTPADRALMCFKQLGSGIPKSPFAGMTEVSFPSACAVSDTRTGDILDAARKLRFPGPGDPKAHGYEYKAHERNGGRDIKVSLIHGNGDRESVSYGMVDGRITDADHSRTNASGGVIFEGHYAFDPTNGALIESNELRTNADGTTTHTVMKHDRQGNLQVTIENSDGTSESYTIPRENPVSRPADPESGGCPQTAAEVRARAMFNCLFAGDLTDVSGRAGLGPLIQTLAPAGTLPAACDALDPGTFWGASTGPGVTDPVPWAVHGGPISFRSFIPRVHGVIDPPRDWTGVPRPGGIPE
ncbi:MAG: hypothetical protein WAT70_05255 [Rhizobiaceae bacterium]